MTELNETNIEDEMDLDPETDCPLEDFIRTGFSDGKTSAEVLVEVLAFNAALPQPLTNDEVLKAVEEIGRSVQVEMGDAELFTLLAKEHLLFKDDLSEPHFFCEGVPFKAPSKEVVARTKHKFYQIKKYMPAPKIVKPTFEILESVARFDRPQIHLANRVSKVDDALYFDLCDRRYVKTSKTGWEIVPAFPLFRRFQHQQQQVVPLSGGNPWKIFDLLAIPAEFHLLVMVYIIALFVPEIAHPLLVLCGDKGSAKSFICNLINRLVDPTLTEKVIKPTNERDLIQTLRQKFLTVLDNITTINDRVSDIFCQVCTGASISYRKLYTDEGENIAQFRHAVILNSISMPIINADLMDRSIILKLERIANGDRRPEQDLWAEFEAAKQEILGGIFDTISTAMTMFECADVKELPRLADFAKWGYAIAEALGKSGDQFLKDFANNVERQNESVVQNNVLCLAVINHMIGKTSELHKVADIHEALKKQVGADSKDSTFPKLPHNLRGHLDLIRPTLMEHGISYQYFDRQNDGVRILLSKTATPDTPASQQAPIVPSESLVRVPGEAGVTMRCRFGNPTHTIYSAINPYPNQVGQIRTFSRKVFDSLVKALSSPVTVAGKGLMTCKCPIEGTLVG